MTDVVRRKLEEFVQKHSGEWLLKATANLGNHDGQVETGTPGLLYARLGNGQVITVWNQIAPSIFDTHVEVGVSKDLPGVWQVTRVRQTYINPASGFIASHSSQHHLSGSDPVFIDRKQLLAFTVLVSDSAGFIVRVYGGITLVNGVIVTAETDTNVNYKEMDLSSYVPTSGAKYVALALQDDGTLSVLDGSTFASPTEGTAADIPAPAFNQTIFAVVILYEAMGALLNDHIRVLLHMGSSQSSTEGLHEHGMERWSAASGDTVLDLSQVAIEIESLTFNGLEEDPLNYTLSADGTQITLSSALPSAMTVVAHYIMEAL